MDSLHDFFAGNENSRPEARHFINLLTRIAIEIDGAVFLNAHPSLEGLRSGTGRAGSTGWNNAVRSRLYQTKPDEDNEDGRRRILTRKKANYAAAGDTIEMTWTDGVFIADPPPGGVVGAIARRNCQDVFLELLDAVTNEGRPVLAKLRAGNYAPTHFAKRPRIGFRRRDFERAMESLFAANRIKLEPYDRPAKGLERIVRA